MQICLCGSMKFVEAFNDWNIICSKAGHIVFSMCPMAYASEEDKRRFDLVHLAKIDASDAILVLNVGGYIGQSTLMEIEYAKMLRKDVFWLKNNDENGSLGVSVWSLYNLFESRPIASVPESAAYRDQPDYSSYKGPLK